MLRVNEDLSIEVTRGDAVTFELTANGGDQVFQPGDVVALRIFEKKNVGNVLLEKRFPVAQESQSVSLVLTGEDTTLGDLNSKPVDYWYEVELNPDTQPQTIIGYDEEGSKVFKLYPEGGEIG